MDIRFPAPCNACLFPAKRIQILTGESQVFFTKAGRVVAVLAIALGALRISMAVMVMYSDNPDAAAQALLNRTTGAAIDQGIYTIIFGIVVGVLTDISRSVSRYRETD